MKLCPFTSGSLGGKLSSGNLTFFHDPPPLAAGEVPSLKKKKKDKRHYSEKVRDTGAALEALSGGLHTKYEI